MPLLSYKLFAKCLVLLHCELGNYTLCFSFLWDLNVQFVLVFIKPLTSNTLRVCTCQGAFILLVTGLKNLDISFSF